MDVIKISVLIIFSISIFKCISVERRCEEEGGYWTGTRCKDSIELKKEGIKKREEEKRKYEEEKRKALEQKEKEEKEEQERLTQEKNLQIEINKKAMIKASKERYRDNRNGTVTDKKTNLIWQRCTLLHNNDKECSYKESLKDLYSGREMWWQSAIHECNKLKLAGKKWRLPTIKELETLVIFEIDGVDRDFLVIDEIAFPNTQPSDYWSISGYPIINTALTLNFNNGDINQYYYSTSIFVRCVSGRK